MSAIEQVPVFGLNQDSRSDKPIKFVTREEARTMKKQKLGWFISSGKEFRLADRIPEVEVVSIYALSKLDRAAVTITLQETQANVGIVDENRIRNPREMIRRAQAKVRWYPHILDNLAPLSGGSWLNSENLCVTAQA